MGVNFELDLRADAFLKQYQRHVNAELNRQHGQLARGLDDLMEGVLNGSSDDEWRTSVSDFAEHWAERGLRLSERTVGAIERMLAEDLEICDGFEGAGELGQEETIFLAAAPRQRAGTRQPDATVRKQTDGVPKPKTSGRYPRGKWIDGTEGNGVIELANAIEIKGQPKLVTHVEFQGGFPILDKWAIPGNEIVIAITGENNFDQVEAHVAWREANKSRLGKEITFHHDARFFQVVEFEGERVFVARMQAVPIELNSLLAHNGSASLARGVTTNKQLAKRVNLLARSGQGPLGRVRKKIGKSIAKRVAKFGRLIPIVGGIITLYSFAEDAEAHGVGGAIARATPLLGDVIAAYDVGNDLAMTIVASAEEAADATIREVNANVKAAHTAAKKAALDAYNEIAKTLRVTSPYIETSDDVANVVVDAITEFYGEVYPVYLKRFQSSDSGSKPSDAEIESHVKKAKRNLRDQLQQNLQAPSTPPPQRPWNEFG